MKYINQVFISKLVLFCICLISFATMSFNPHPINKDRCVHSSHFEDSYIMKKNELVIIKAIKHHGYEVKRGVVDIYGKDKEAHHWRIININTTDGHIDEVVVKIEQTKDTGKTKFTAISICINEELSDNEFDNRVKLYRKYIKTRIVNNIKSYKG